MTSLQSTIDDADLARLGDLGMIIGKNIMAFKAQQKRMDFYISVYLKTLNGGYDTDEADSAAIEALGHFDAMFPTPKP
jgi:hypothetical protein